MSDEAYRATLAHLYRLRRFGTRPGLEVIRSLLTALGNPEQRFPSIHVAGSKGKGSVAALTSAILTANHYTTGLFTSPHLRSYRERMQVDRHPIGPDEVADRVGRVREVAESLERVGKISRPPTFFEVTTAVAFDWFASRHVDAAVVEAGLGGRLDATNVLRAPVAIITTIELEHTDVLGSTLEAIAREKGGILHPGMRAVVAESKPVPRIEIDRIAADQNVPVWHLDREIRVGERTLSETGQRFVVDTPHRKLPDLELPLLGNFQARNAATAVAGADLWAAGTGGTISERDLRRGLKEVSWPGRLERAARRPDLYVDVAHTPESARAVAQSLAELFPFADPTNNVVLFGCLQGKRAGEMFEQFGLVATTVVLTPIHSDRSTDVAELRREARTRFPFVVAASGAAEALRVARAGTAPDGFTLAAGSDYLIGELLNHLEGTSSDEPDLSDPSLRSPGTETERPAVGPTRSGH